MGRMIWIILLALLFLTACGEEEATPTPIPPPAQTPPALVSPEPPILTGLTPEAPPPTPQPTATPMPSGGTVILWHSWAGADGDALERILTEFQRAEPEIEVQTLFVAYSRLPQAYADAVYAGGGPDLLLAPNWWLQDLAAIDALAPIADEIDRALLARYAPAALENLTYDGRLYGLPTNFELVSLYYNAGLIAPDQLPGSMQDLLALAQSDPSLGSGLYMNLYHLYWGITGYGGTLFDGEGRVILNQTPGTAEFLSWLRQMSETPGVFVSQDYGMLIDRFKKGEYAFFVDGPWSQVELTQALGDDLGVAPLPAGPAGPSRPWLSADGLFFNPASSVHQRSLALTLADHMTSPASGSVLAEIARRIPAQVDAVVADPLLLAFAQQAQVALSEPHRPEMLEVWGYAGDMLIKVVDADMDPVEVVRETSLLINEANGK